MKNEIENTRENSFNEEALEEFFTPLKDREGYISPVTFIELNDKTHGVESVKLGVACHPSCYADYVINKCGAMLSNGNGLEKIDGDELITCAYTIDYTFKSRAMIELYNVALYIYGDICGTYGVPMGYHIPDMRNLNMIKNTPNPSTQPEEITAFSYIHGASSERKCLDLTDIQQYGSTITRYTIPYIANALVTKAISDAAMTEDEIVLRNSVDKMEELGEAMPQYHAVVMSVLANLLNLANFYRSANPCYLKVAAGYEID